MQDHISQSEVFLNKEERLNIIKGLLEKIVKSIASSGGENTIEVVRDSLEELSLHVEAAGPELHLNERERTVWLTLNKCRTSSLQSVAQWSAQLLGALNHEERFPADLRQESVVFKGAFLNEFVTLVDNVLKKKTLGNLLELEELISGFTCHEEYDFDPEVLKLCFGIEECVRDVLVYGYEISTVRLEIQKNIALLMRGELKIALS